MITAVQPMEYMVSEENRIFLLVHNDMNEIGSVIIVTYLSKDL